MIAKSCNCFSCKLENGIKKPILSISQNIVKYSTVNWEKIFAQFDENFCLELSFSSCTYFDREVFKSSLLGRANLECNIAEVVC